MLNIISLLENIQANQTKSITHYAYDHGLMETMSTVDVIPMMDNAIIEAVTDFGYDMLTLDESLIESAMSSSFDTMVEDAVGTIKEKAKAALEKIIQAVKNIFMRLKNWTDRTFKISERWAKKAKEALKKVPNDRTTKLPHTYNEQWILVDLSKDAQEIGYYGLNDVINAQSIDQEHDSDDKLSVDEQKRLVIKHIEDKIKVKLDGLDVNKIKESLDEKTYTKDSVTYINPTAAQQLVSIIEKSAKGTKDIIDSYDEVIKRLETIKNILYTSRWSTPQKMKKEGYDKDSIKAVTESTKLSIGVVDTTMRAVNTIRSYQVKTINAMYKEYTSAVNSLISGNTDSGKIDASKKDDNVEHVDAEVVDDPKQKSGNKNTDKVIDADYEDVK